MIRSVNLEEIAVEITKARTKGENLRADNGIDLPDSKLSLPALTDEDIGHPEITDAAMAERAECVMLNKGPYVVQAVQMLDDVLRRMQSHQTKKISLLRQLNLADRFCGRATI